MKERNIVTCVILTIVTCGIYGIYWLICLAKDSATVKDPNTSYVLNAVLMILLPFLGFFLAEKKMKEEMGSTSNNSIIYLILGLLGLSIVNACMMQNDLNKYIASQK